MRYMLITQATARTEAGVHASRERAQRIGAYHAAMARAGVLVAAERLYPSSSGLRMYYREPDGRPSCVPGPLSEAKELAAGYTIIEVESEEEALDWAMRMPDPDGYGSGIVELRRMIDDQEAAREYGAGSLAYELRGRIGMRSGITAYHWRSDRR